MVGRIRRKAGLAEAAALAVRPFATADRCALCDRLLGKRTEWHHVVPRSEGGTATVPVHPVCHRAVHAALSNADLARAGTVDAIRDVPAVARFLRWISDKPADFHAPTRRARGDR